MREELPRKGMGVHPPEERGIGLKRLRGGSGEGLSTFKAFLRLLCGALLELERFSNIQRPFLPQGRAGSRGVQFPIEFAIVARTGGLFPRIRPAFAGAKACRHCAVRIRRDAARAFP